VNVLFTQSRSAAGSRSIMLMMNKAGIQIGQFNVHKLIREMNLISKQPGSNAYKKATMARLFRSLKTEWVPVVGYMNASLTQQDIGQFLMQRYNWKRPHHFNGALPRPLSPRKNLTQCPGLADHYILIDRHIVYSERVAHV
jgi:hypothetical protein